MRNTRALRRRLLAVVAALLLTLGTNASPSHAASGFAAVLAGQNAIPPTTEGQLVVLVVLLQNAGSVAWERGGPTQVDLASCAPDRSACDVADPALAAWNPGTWLRPTRFATPTQAVVRPGAIATFVYSVTVPSGQSADVRFNGEPVIAATGERIGAIGYSHELRVTARSRPSPLLSLLTPSALGPSFRMESERIETLADRAALFEDPVAARADLGTWGFIDGARREYRSATSRDTWFVRILVYRYPTPASAALDLASWRRGHLSEPPAGLPLIADGSSSYVTTTTSTDGTPATRSTIVMQVGTASVAVILWSRPSAADAEYNEAVARSQAQLLGMRTQSPPAAVVRAETQTTASVGGLSFKRSATTLRDVHVESSISAEDTRTILATFDRDVAHLQAVYGRSVLAPIRTFVFATNASARAGLVSIFGQPPLEAARLSLFAAGLYFSREHSVMVNWEQSRNALPLSIIRHELSHYFMREVVGPVRIQEVPAWFDEGFARLQEWTIDASRWSGRFNKYSALSMAGVGPVPSLLQLADLDSFQSGTEDRQLSNYYISSQAMEMVMNAAGTSGVIRILELVRDGTEFSAAFARVAGSSYPAFAVSFRTALGRVDWTPGLTTAPDTAEGADGFTVILYGFRPFATINVAISGRGNASFVRTTNANGVAIAYYASRSLWTGTYTIAASSGATRVERTVRAIGARAGALSDGPASLDGIREPVLPLAR